MTRQTNQNWQQQSERSNTFTLKLIAWIALHTSRGITRLLLYPIVLYYFLFAPRARYASRQYLQRVFSQPVRTTQVAKHIYTFAATILDRVYFLTDKLDMLDVKVHHFEVVEKYRNQKRGVILLGSHLGSFDAMRSLAFSNIKVPLKILMYQQHNQMITHVLETLNPKVAASVIDLGDANAMLKVNDAINTGHMIGILGDRVAENDRSIPCKLLGGEVELPAGAILLASVLKAPVILFYCLYMGDNRYEIFFEEFAENVEISRKEREQQLTAWCQKYADRLEFYIKKAPYNWFNFYDYWHDK